MTKQITLTPTSPLEGTPITLVLETGKGKPPVAIVRRLNLRTEESFQVTLTPSSEGKAQAQFALYEAGAYQIEVGKDRVLFEVLEARNVSLITELGVVSILVITITAGIIGWIRTKKNQN